MEKKGTIKECIACKSSFYVSKCELKRRFCSHKCYWADKIGKPRNGNPKKWKHTAETKEKLKILRIGKKCSNETRMKMSLSAKVVVRTEEWNKNVGVALRGRKKPKGFGEKVRLWMLGRKPKNLAQLAEISRTRNNMKRPEVRAKLSGASNKWWKGGKTPIAKQIRECFEYMEWRRAIYKRDNWTCVLCGQRGGKLNVDHYPITFSEIFYKNSIKSLNEAKNCLEFWSLDNGRTLCEPCHKKTDTWGFRALNKLEYLGTI